MYFYMWLYYAFYKFLEVQIMHNIGKKGCRFQLCRQFLTVFFLSQGMVMSQMSLHVHRAGPPFLDPHYRGYQ